MATNGRRGCRASILPTRIFKSFGFRPLARTMPQKELLDKLHEKQGEEVFVASFSAIKSPMGGSSATHMDGDNEFAIAENRRAGAWADRRGTCDGRMAEVLDVVGDMMEPLDIYPPRFA